MTFRKSVFWVHLAAGLLAGLVILIMSFTGTAIAFQKEVVAYVERDSMQVTPPAVHAPRLPLKELIDHARNTKPDSPPTGFTVSSDPTQVVQVAFGRDGTCYVNPYTGDVHEPGAPQWRAFFLTMENWHRFLGRSGGQRALGKAVNDACNAAFLFLAISGLFLWWPRKWRTKGLKRSLRFLPDATGRARDWNWHNVIGFWSAPILIILTSTGVVMSYRWANDLVYKATGSPVPVQQAPGNSRPPAVSAAKVPQSGTIPEALAKDDSLAYDALLTAAQKQSPGWDTLTFRLGSGTPEARPAPQPVVITIKEPTTSPWFGNTTLTFDPITGGLLKRETFADGTLGRRVRSWIRFLHTGEAFGWVSQFIAALASLGACFLVYTGFAMSWRRFFMKKEPKPVGSP